MQSMNMEAKAAFYSIVIPTYNRASILRETIANLQAQHFTNWECIIVDDGSTDDTKDVVASIMSGEPRIRYVFQENAERSAARNNGFRNSNGKYVIFLDSDDAFDPSYLKELHTYLKQKEFPVGLIVSNYCSWDGAEQKNEVESADVYDNPSEWLFDFPVSPSRAVVHASVLKEFSFREDIVIVEDTVLWVTIMNKYPLFHFTPHLVWYRVHEGNSVNPETDHSLRRYRGLILFFAHKHSKLLSRSFKNKILSDTLFQLGQYYIYAQKKWKAMIALLRSISYQPLHPQTKAKIYLLLKLTPVVGSLFGKSNR